MEAPLGGQIASSVLLAARFAGLYIQTKYPDVQRMRKVAIGITSINALSYALHSAWTAATVQTGAAIRNTLLSTKWGAKHQKLLVVSSSLATISAALLIRGSLPKDAEQTLPLVGTVVGAAADLQNQGRYTRAIYSAYPFIWLPIRWQTRDIPGGLSDLLVTGIQVQGLYKNDIKNAAGQNQPLSENMKAWLHGIFFNSATGAHTLGQVEVKPGVENSRAQYVKKLKSKLNPYFHDQYSVLTRMELHFA